MAAATEFTWGTGRRKSAIARVRLTAGSGNIQVNGKAMNEYFVTEHQRVPVMRPLKAADLEGKFDIHINVIGGGVQAQSEAAQLGMARAIMSINDELSPALKEQSLLTRDPRMKERKKYGQHGARKGTQFSKR